MQTKECIKCHGVFPLEDAFFGRRKDSHDGFRNDCKECVKKRRDEWHKKNRSDQLSKMKKYWIKNREAMLCYKSEYNQNNRVTINKKSRIYYKDNREKIFSQVKKFRDENKDRINQDRREARQINYEHYVKWRNEYDAKNSEHIRRRSARYCANRRETDIRYRILNNLRSRVSSALKKSHKSKRTMDLVGCTLEELKKHLEKQFCEGMTWDNYGEWHVDHIVPCAVFNLQDPDEQCICFHYSNLQPLWAIDNLKKHAKIVS